MGFILSTCIRTFRVPWTWRSPVRVGRVTCFVLHTNCVLWVFNIQKHFGDVMCHLFLLRYIAVSICCNIIIIVDVKSPLKIRSVNCIYSMLTVTEEARSHGKKFKEPSKNRKITINIIQWLAYNWAVWPI